MTAPSPADLRKSADRFEAADKWNRAWLSPEELIWAAAALRFQAAAIEREAYRIQQAAIEAREPRPLHTGRRT